MLVTPPDGTDLRDSLAWLQRSRAAPPLHVDVTFDGPWRGRFARGEGTRSPAAPRGKWLLRDFVWAQGAIGESVRSGLYTVGMARDVVHQLLATDVALDKLGARTISAEEAEQLPRNRHLLVGNPRGGVAADKRRLLIGHTDGGRPLTLVIERTADPTTWLIVTGWASTQAERKILEARQ